MKTVLVHHNVARYGGAENLIGEFDFKGNIPRDGNFIHLDGSLYEVMGVDYYLNQNVIQVRLKKVS